MVFLLILISMLSLASFVSTEHYYIVPDNSTGVCDKYGNEFCYTLDQFAVERKRHSGHNITLSFLPGKHKLTQLVSFTETTSEILNVTLMGNKSSSSISCLGTSGFLFSNIHSLTIAYLEFSGCGGYQAIGGAISIINVNHVLVRHCYFVGNHVTDGKTGGGAAINANCTKELRIDTSFFIDNFVHCKNTYWLCDGGAIHAKGGNTFITYSRFTNNMAEVYGGAICVASNGSLFSNYNQFINNTAGVGGAICVEDSQTFINNSQFKNNLADGFGGAVFADNASVSTSNSHFTNNIGTDGGGAIYVEYGQMFSINSNYTSNRNLDKGGAVHVVDGSLFSTGNRYESNTADEGGAIYLRTSSRSRAVPVQIDTSLTKFIQTSHISGDYFANNTARSGAVIYSYKSKVDVRLTSFSGNSAMNKQVLYVDTTTVKFLEGISFMNNHGSLYAFNSQVEFHGLSTFLNNTGVFGGAIASVQSQIYFNSSFGIHIANNRAKYGGGISLIEGTLVVYHPINITRNTADISGGGIYAYQSSVKLKTHYATINIADNYASQNGGGICAVASSLKISRSFVQIESNTAKANGGAIYLEQNSKIYVLKYEWEGTTNILPEVVAPEYFPVSVRLDITNNSAQFGGGVHVSDNSTAGVLCQLLGTSMETGQSFGIFECFIQTIKLYDIWFEKSNSINTRFKDNKASHSGRDIYGGLLDRCTINSLAEIFAALSFNNSVSKGFDYIKTTVQIDQIIDYDNLHNPSELLISVNESNVKGYITSDGVQVLLCEHTTDIFRHASAPVFVKKGELFKLSVVSVDQVGNPVNATIISSVSSKSGIGRLKEGQAEQRIGGQCTELEYNVYSLDSSAKILLYADGPCSNLGISEQTVNVIFLPCTCPIGFTPTMSKIDCVCDCDQTLKEHHITNCSAENGTLRVETNIWIGVSNSINGTGYVIQNCPFDYCVDKPVNLNLNSSYEIDKQCSFNRMGTLCGECEEGLSLVFASTRCKECTNIFLLLLILFALAGIALVVFILLLNITIATGTIHGLIFYANILAGNRSIFLPFDTPNILTIFISWLNIDLGIETCFYDGMNSQAKVLLQLAFPAYLFLLIFLIIILCEYSKRLSTLLANRNPVAALCTLILLSYSKLLRMIIAAIQYQYLDYPNGSREVVWLYDANVQYFSVSHIPRFVLASIIFILGGVYTVLLFLGQWLPHCSNWKVMKWIKNTKYNAFIDAYHAPFTPKHRYWMGLLLFAQIVHNLVTAMATDSYLPVLSAGCIAQVLVMIKLLNSKIYKNRLQDSLETLFLINLVLLAIATFYVGVTKGNQQALAITSMAISFILFWGITCYHCYKYIPKNLKVWAKRTHCQVFRRRTHSHSTHTMHQLVRDVDDNEPTYDDFQRDVPNSLYTGESREEVNSQNYTTPPIIRPAVRYDQLREPDLDILAPIDTDDYTSTIPPTPPRVHEPPVITYTVIDAIPKTQ